MIIDKRNKDYLDLSIASNDELENIMQTGTLPKMEDLAGWEFKGLNTPDFASFLGIRKFKKGFMPDPENPDKVIGFNVKVKQNGLIDPWVDVTCKGKPVRFGWYHVYPASSDASFNKYTNAQLINYNSDKNFPLDPTKLLRDYLVQVHPDNPDLFLGKAFITLGLTDVFVSYFLLGRNNPVE